MYQTLGGILFSRSAEPVDVGSAPCQPFETQTWVARTPAPYYSIQTDLNYSKILLFKGGESERTGAVEK